MYRREKFPLVIQRIAGLFKSLMAGASGYLLKHTPPSEILDAIADVQIGGSPMTNSIARKVVQFFQQRLFGRVADMSALVSQFL